MSADSPCLSVVIPTHTPEVLDKCLSSLSHQTERRFEVVVVANGPAGGHIAEMAERYSNRIRLRVVRVPDPGLNRARNAGVAHSRAPLISLLDDDCWVDPRWVREAIAAHGRYPDAGVIGGPVNLSFTHPIPGWLTGPFRALLSEIDWGEHEKVLTSNQWLVGANLSFRRSTWFDVAGFEDSIGLVGQGWPKLCNDEVEFVARASRISEPGRVYAPGMRAEHVISPVRTGLPYMISRTSGQGVSDVELLRHQTDRFIDNELLAMLLRKVNDKTWCKVRDYWSDKLHGTAKKTFRINTVICRVTYLAGLRAAIRNLSRAEHRNWAKSIEPVGDDLQRLGEYDALADKIRDGIKSKETSSGTRTAITAVCEHIARLQEVLATQCKSGSAATFFPED